jgi:hypothetical protein
MGLPKSFFGCSKTTNRERRANASDSKSRSQSRTHEALPPKKKRRKSRTGDATSQKQHGQFSRICGGGSVRLAGAPTGPGGCCAKLGALTDFQKDHAPPALRHKRPNKKENCSPPNYLPPRASRLLWSVSSRSTRSWAAWRRSRAWTSFASTSACVAATPVSDATCLVTGEKGGGGGGGGESSNRYCKTKRGEPKQHKNKGSEDALIITKTEQTPAAGRKHKSQKSGGKESPKKKNMGKLVKREKTREGKRQGKGKGDKERQKRTIRRAPPTTTDVSAKPPTTAAVPTPRDRIRSARAPMYMAIFRFCLVGFGERRESKESTHRARRAGEAGCKKNSNF